MYAKQVVMLGKRQLIYAFLGYLFFMDLIREPLLALPTEPFTVTEALTSIRDP